MVKGSIRDSSDRPLWVGENLKFCRLSLGPRTTRQLEGNAGVTYTPVMSARASRHGKLDLMLIDFVAYARLLSLYVGEM